MTALGALTTLAELTGNGPTNRGTTPSGDLVQGSNGDDNFYGTTTYGGGYGFGTIFTITPAGVLTTLMDFGPVNVGAAPRGPLAQGSDGNFYGTASDGGVVLEFGTVFKVTPAGTMTVLVEFTNNEATNKGRYPYAGLVRGRDGDFYGTTFSGGAGDFGTVFKMTPGGDLTTLAEFTDNGATNKGSFPYAGLVQGASGDDNFYGATISGGANYLGTIFKITPAGALTTLVHFTGNDGINIGKRPSAGLVRATDGNFYGTTFNGGASDSGTVFKMTPAGVMTTLVEFTPFIGPDPEIALEQPAGTNLVDSTGSVAFGAVLTGAAVSRTFTVRNTGFEDLTGLGITFDGAAPADFTVTASPTAPVAGGGSTTFTVRFAPVIAGIKATALHIANNDSDEAPFDLALTGRALAPNADDDSDGISNATELNLTALGFDPLVDSSALRAALHTNAPGLGLYTAADLQALALGTPVLTRDAVTGRFHLTISVEKSPNLSGWTPLTGFTPTYDAQTGEIDIDFTPGASNAQFYRVLGTKP